MIGLQQRHSLRPLPLAVDQLAARLEAGGLELLGEILDRFRLAGSGRAATLEAVVRQGADVLAELGFVERGVLGDGGRWEDHCGGGEEKRLTDHACTPSAEMSCGFPCPLGFP